MNMKSNKIRLSALFLLKGDVFIDKDNKNALILALMLALKVIKKYLGLFILLFIK